MHASILDWFKTFPAEVFTGKTVLEVGSYDVNGSVKPIVLEKCPKSYLGVDMAAGPNVDYVVDAVDLTRRFGYAKYDVVICCEMLEHAEDWRTSLQQMKEILKLGGLLIITTRSEGFPYHGYPDDHWRYSIEDMKKIFADFEIEELIKDPQDPGVFVAARKLPLMSKQRMVDLSEIDLFSMK